MTRSTSTKPGGRLLSLDVFRGATVAGMMIVNHPGSSAHIYPPFGHSAWNGWTFADVIFPFFLWIVGVAMTFSFSKRVEQGADRQKLMLHTLRRSFTIFAIGLLLGLPFGFIFGGQFSWATFRILGVLQRIAICYLIAGSIVLYAGRLWQVRWTVIFLVVYWILIKTVPVPEFGAGAIDQAKGSLAWHIDSILLRGHTWSATAVPGFDTEGILSTLPAIATTLFGVLTGHFIRSDRTQEEKTAWMFIFGNGLIFTGLLMDNWLPINKTLWTSSYSVFMAGLALNVFAFCYWLIDVKGYKGWTKPFQIYGLNAITVFAIAGFVTRPATRIMLTGSDGNPVDLGTWYYQTFFLWMGDPMFASFMHSVVFMLGLYFIAWVMYRRNIILRV